VIKKSVLSHQSLKSQFNFSFVLFASLMMYLPILSQPITNLSEFVLLLLPTKEVMDIGRQAGVDTTLVKLHALGSPPCIDLSNVHFVLEVEDHQFNMAQLSAQIIAATRTLTALPLVDIYLWTDGLVSANAIFVYGTLRVADASSAGHGVSKLRPEAIACFAGLQVGLLNEVRICEIQILNLNLYLFSAL